MADFQRTVAIPGLMSDPNAYDSVAGAVRTLARANVFNGASPSRALQDAKNAVLNFDYAQGGRARAPRGLAAQAEQTGASILSTLTPNDLAPAQGGEGFTDADRAASALASVQKNGTWITNQKGDGWTLRVQTKDGWQKPLKADGSEIGFRFRDMPQGTPSGASSGAPDAGGVSMIAPTFGGT